MTMFDQILCRKKAFLQNVHLFALFLDMYSSIPRIQFTRLHSCASVVKGLTLPTVITPPRDHFSSYVWATCSFWFACFLECPPRSLKSTSLFRRCFAVYSMQCTPISVSICLHRGVGCGSSIPVLLSDRTSWVDNYRRSSCPDSPSTS